MESTGGSDIGEMLYLVYYPVQPCTATCVQVRVRSIWWIFLAYELSNIVEPVAEIR